MMTPETAMRQAAITANGYFMDSVTVVEGEYPKASFDAKAIAASNLAIAASLDYLAAVLGGHIRSDSEDFSKSRVQR
jgi:hypothetical protein